MTLSGISNVPKNSASSQQVKTESAPSAQKRASTEEQRHIIDVLSHSGKPPQNSGTGKPNWASTGGDHKNPTSFYALG